MQNIKICPKCNQASTDANNAFCPLDGTALVEMQPTQNQQWQSPPESQPQVISTASSAPKKKMNSLMIGCLALIGIPIVLGALFYSMSTNKATKNANSTNSVSSNDNSLQNTAASLTNQNSYPDINASNSMYIMDKNGKVKKVPVPPPVLSTEKTRDQAFEAGYKVGLKDGRNPDNPQVFSAFHFNSMVGGAVAEEKPKEPTAWAAGYRKGFRETFKGIIDN